MNPDYGERIRAVETTQANHAHEIERLRDGHHSFREQLGIIGSQLAQLTLQVQHVTSQADVIAKRAAHEVLSAYLAQQKDGDETSVRKLAFRVVLLALGVAAAALGVKFAGFT